jgi:hypothetical protein
VIPREAREGVMRAWLEILRQRHPGVTWIPAETVEDDDQPERQDLKRPPSTPHRPTSSTGDCG